jgi:hypothetical protein
MSQRIFKISILMTVVAVVAIQTYTQIFSVEAQEKKKPTIADCFTPNPIDELNEAVLKRFTDFRKGFGYARVIQIRAINAPSHFDVFRAENDAEHLLVNNLKANNLNLNLFLAGRRILQDVQPPAKDTIFLNSPIRGPVLVTEAEPDKNLPNATSEDFIRQVRKALKSFDKGNEYQFTSGKWKIAARPVRASENSCVECHQARINLELGANADQNEIKIGDPLGVLLYVYREKKFKEK